MGISFTLPQALRAQGLLKEAEHVESQSAETVLTPDECQLGGRINDHIVNYYLHGESLSKLASGI